MNSEHKWTFFRAGGVDQVRLENGADILALDELDQKLWVALACPTSGLEFDPRTLELIDADKDGRIHPHEVIAAAKWAGERLKNPDDLLKGSPELPLSAINDSTPEGKQLLASARRILTNLGKENSATVSVEDSGNTVKIFGEANFNGDGIIAPDAASDESTRTVINDIIASLGPETDRSGKPGVNQAKVDQFFAEAAAYSDWWKKAELDPAIMPFDGATSAAAETYHALKTKIDDYFTRCRVAAFDPRAVNALNREEKEYAAVAAKDLNSSSLDLAGFPLSQAGAGKPLSLSEGVNPAWAALLDKFETQVVRPVLNGKSSITEADWGVIIAKFAGYYSWTAAKAGAAVEKLGLPRVREILASDAQERIIALIARDKALEPEAASVAAVEQLARYHRDLFKFLNNFVSFRDFYSRKDKATFQAGTLYLDQRSCDLCMSVEDPAKHATLAGMAGAYLAYCDCARKSTGEKRQIVAAFTAGDSDNLFVGRNGIFYDRKGRDWDATIAKIIDNPISIRQAFWTPYKKLVRMVEEQVAKRAAAADASATDKMALAATNVAKVDQAAQAKKPAEPRKLDVGVVAALGVAVGAIGTALTSLATGLMRIPPWQIPLVFLGLILLISLPSMVVAALKLRKRNLGPLLDANGWAINARARINLPFGGVLTKEAALPPGAHRDQTDPFPEKKSPWPKVLIFVIVLWIIYTVLNSMGYIYEWSNGRIGSPRPAAAGLNATTPATPEAGAGTAPSQ